MRVFYAFKLFSDKVLNGLRLYETKLESCCGRIQPVLIFFGMIGTLIEIMTSRSPSQGLRPECASVGKLLSFLTYLTEWELHAGGRGGLLSTSTAVGLRVTVESVLSLLTYLKKNVSYKYLMTSKLSQDPVENLFGIARQSNGCNAHPTPQQFLITVCCLSFCGLARSVANGNAEPGVLTAILEPDMMEGPKPCKTDIIQSLLDDNDIPTGVHQKQGPVPDHVSCVQAKSTHRLIFYICGYVSRKFLLKSECDECHKLLLTKKDDVYRLAAAHYTRLRDNGCLLYPTRWLFRFIRRLENLFRATFRTQELYHESVMDFIGLVKKNRQDQIGCASHVESLTVKVVAFYVTTRLHFFCEILKGPLTRSGHFELTSAGHTVRASDRVCK
ncbi:uncharacterized protein LOC142576669 [Dermacentor variabilis]|uniref:uncharacterized protein LOC142576669 n=1 Tax=Dermacentor variabilis TaxID=34621 RepID=UPI003F5B3F40